MSTTPFELLSDDGDTPPEGRPELVQALAGHEDRVDEAIVHAVDDFYAHAQQHPGIGPFLQRLGEDGLDRLIRAQREHAWAILSVLTDEERDRRARRAGRRHALFGVAPDYLVEATALYANCLLEALGPLLRRDNQLRDLLLQRLGRDLSAQLAGMDDARAIEAKITEQIDLLLVAELPVIQLAPRILEQLLAIPGVAATWLAEPDGRGGLRILAHTGEGMTSYLEGVDIRIDDSESASGPAGQAWRLAQPVIVDDIETYPHYGPWREAARSRSWRSTATLPIKRGERVRALLGLYSNLPGFFSNPQRQRLLQHLAVMLGIALRRLEQHRHLEQVHGLYRAFLAEGDVLIRARSEAEMLRRSCQRLAESAFFSAVAVVRPDRDGWFRPLASAGRGSNILANLHIHADQREPPSVVGEAWQSHRLRYHNDYCSDPRYAAYHATFHSLGWASSAAIPILRGGALWGLLTITSAEKDVFDEETLRALARISRLLGFGLDELDLRERIEQERKVQSWMARHDALTGLPNRVALLDRIPDAMQRANRADQLLAICMLDLDDFKPINDRYGHAAGDALLRSLAQRLQGVLRKTDFIARMGGDEFALVLEGLQRLDNLEQLLDRIALAIQTPTLLPGGIEAHTGGSLGVSIYPFDDGDAEQLLRHADHAMYRAKIGKHHRSHFWELYQGTEEGREEPAPYGTLLHSGGLVPYFQPMIALASGEVVGFEALARLQQSGLLLTPVHFLGQLNRSDQRELARRMLMEALELAAEGARRGRHLEVSVNVGPDLLLDSSFTDLLRRILSQSGVAPSQLTLEILESGEFLNLALARDRIDEIRHLGVRIALDDVGSAYASLLRLREIAVDEVKLDQGFVREIGTRPEDLNFVLNVGGLAQAIGARYVVEGVEDLSILDALGVLAIPYVQGYSIARPMPAAEVWVWLEHYRPQPQPDLPQTLLGAYAAHLQFDAVHRLAPKVVQRLPNLGDHGACRLGRFLREHRLEDTSLAAAHCAYHVALLHQDEAALAVARVAMARAIQELQREKTASASTPSV
ncbi:MAG: EAL domain-containing protein [Acidithiobacillus sp.]|uniref:EAL domain-containing protein n=1 Tax=Acidithiobacillus sp. TaxID=1872118 RepID=UPI003D014505